MSKINFLLQGLSETEDHYAALDRLLNLPEVNKCLISVAFMNMAGASMVVDKLAMLSDRLNLFVGIRNGVTSKQSVEVLIENGISPICVDTATQAFIFHPKVYLAQNQVAATLITGSANFTSGGLVKNIEASLVVDLDLALTEDMILVEKVIQDFGELQSRYPENVFQLDDTYDLDELVNQGLLVDETIQLHRVSAQALGLINRTEQRPCMKTNVRKIKVRKQVKEKKSVSIWTSFFDASSVEVINKQLLWKSGPLTRRDLNIPTGTNTHATGSMLLKIGDPSQDFDQRHYFRDTVFANANWNFDSRPQYKHIERCVVRFRVVIKGIDYGVHELKISHNTRTDTETYRQKNSMTQIHWGEVVKPLIAHEDLLKGRLCIYAPEPGTDVFTLIFDLE